MPPKDFLHFLTAHIGSGIFLAFDLVNYRFVFSLILHIVCLF